MAGSDCINDHCFCKTDGSCCGCGKKSPITPKPEVSEEVGV